VTGDFVAKNLGGSQSFVAGMSGAQVSISRSGDLPTIDLERGVFASGAVAYRWDITTDELSWSGNVEQVLGLPAAMLSTGKQYASYLDPENLTTRFDAIVHSKSHDEGRGVPYEIECQMQAGGQRPADITWVEDCGRWHAGEGNRPAVAFGLVRRIDERHLKNQALLHQSATDPLTGTFNRSRMTDLLEGVIANTLREHASCGFAIAAISNLGVINEAYGFEVADEVIAQIALRLRTVMRNGDVIARYSGSKFGFILNSCTPADLAIAAERLLSIVRDNVIETSRGPVWAALALGTVSVPETAQTSAKAIAFAEEALNEARLKPSDPSVIYKHSESRQIKHTLNARCAEEIVKCLRDGSFKLAFQPVQDAASGKLVMHEALLRMIDTGGEVIPAGHLVPVAERIGLIRLIDRAVVQLAITALHSHPEAVISINISANSVVDANWNAELIDLIGADQKLARRLIVELNESVVFSSSDVSQKFIAGLQAIGCRIAVDDFGAGFASFRNVLGQRIDIIKLDGSFCRDLKASPEARYYAKSLIGLGKTLGLKSIAEWVETEEDAVVLRELGVDYLQGLHIGDAIIDPPWTSDAGAAFDLTPESPPDQEQAVVIDQTEQHPLEAVSYLIDDQQAEPEASTGNYDYEDGIRKLGDTLALLNGLNRTRPGSEDLREAV
jgi:diguanylate cyclase (GGDEF)-like protein